jgi:release factor glutamine methyltransferase
MRDRSTLRVHRPSLLALADGRGDPGTVRLTVARRLAREAGLSRNMITLAPSESSSDAIRILSIPGVFAPWDDSALLAQALNAEKFKPGAQVLDMCTGSGVLSIVAARLGAGRVTAVDVSRRALICTQLNALSHRARIHTRRGDLFRALGEGARFDVIVSNPPWLPSDTESLPGRGLSRAWEAGRNGRALIDRVCAGAPGHLCPGGFLLLVQASFCDIPETMEALTAQGLNVEIAARRVVPGSTTWQSKRASELQQHGPWARDDAGYEIAVIRASRPD